MSAFVNLPHLRNSFSRATFPSTRRTEPTPRTSTRVQLSNNNGEGARPDWRDFRARLVQKESGTDAAAASCKARTGDWAHEVPFVELGTVLIASPEHFVGERARSFFANSAVLIISDEHSAARGSVGVILNRPLRGPFMGFGKRSAAVYLGGPMGVDETLAMHGRAEARGATEVMGGVYVSRAAETGRLMEEGALREEECRLYCGYAGWADGQLEEERAGGVWYTCACCPGLVRGWAGGKDGGRGGEEKLVEHLLELMGGRYKEIGRRIRDSGSAGRSFEI